MSMFSFHDQTQLRSGRVVNLRTPQVGDGQKLLDFVNDIIDENPFVLINKKQTLDSEKKYIEDCLEKVRKNDGIFLYATTGDRIVGVCDIKRQRDKMSHSGLLGIMISSDFRGVGLGRLLMEKVLELAKNQLGLEMVVLSCFANNEPAISLYRSLGFNDAGRTPKLIKHKGQYVDQLMMYREL